MAYLENVQTFVRVYELGSMSAAARDLRISAAVASSRIAQLETHLNIRLFQRTTRSLQPTEQGRLFYDGAQRILEAVATAESEISEITRAPRGSLYIAAPIGFGQRVVAPAIPAFQAEYPLIHLRLRLSDRRLDVAQEGLDAAFLLGTPEDSVLHMRKIADCPRVLCAAPAYLARKGMPDSPDALSNGAHDCLNLRFPGAPEFRWPLLTERGPVAVPVRGPFESDHADVLTQWALEGYGIILRPRFEMAEHLASGRLVEVMADTPPTPVTLAVLYRHRRLQDPKLRLFMEFMAGRISDVLDGDPSRAVTSRDRSNSRTAPAAAGHGSDPAASSGSGSG